MSNRGQSLRTVVIGAVIIGLGVPLTLATLYSSNVVSNQLMNEARISHERSIARLESGIRAPLGAYDLLGVTHLVKSFLDDTRVVEIVVRDAQGAIILKDGDESRRAASSTLSLERSVTERGKIIGSVRLDFSLNRVEAAIAERFTELVVVATVQLAACIALLLFLINTRILSRIQSLKSQALLLARKDLDQPFAWTPDDEIGELGMSLEETRVALKSLFKDLESINLNLETLVAERTMTLRMILDNVRFGFLVIDSDLLVQRGYTRSCEKLFGCTNLESRKLSLLLGLEDAAVENFDLSLEQVFEDVFPEEASLAQVPRRSQLGGRTLALEGSTLRNRDGKIEKILFTVIDATDLEKAERENLNNRAIINILQNITTFQEFIADSKKRLSDGTKAVANGDQRKIRMELHAIKGNSAAFGLEGIVHLIHQIEDQATITYESCKAVEARFIRFLEQHFEFFKISYHEKAEDVLSIPRSHLMSFKNKLATLKTQEALVSSIDDWLQSIQQVPAASLLGPIDLYVKKLATARAKNISYSVTGGDIMVDPARLNPVVQNLVHLIRNAVDHGIEGPGERGAKPAAARISVTFMESGPLLRIIVSDDGRGINAKRVLEKAVKIGLCSPEAASKMSPEEAINLIFVDFLSTAEAVSDTSGRGVGMGAIREAVEGLGGRIKIESNPGVGTTILIEIPRQEVTRTRLAG